MPEATVKALVKIRIDPLAESDVDETVHADLDSLSRALAAATQFGLEDAPELAFRSADETPVELTFLGRRTHNAVAKLPGTMPVANEPTEDVRAAARQHGKRVDVATWRVFVPETGNEFSASIQAAALRRIGRQAEQAGVQEAGRGIDERTPPGPGRQDPSDDADETTFRGWSDGMDSRVLVGTYDVAHQDATYQKMVSLGDGGGCSATLFGRHHMITAAHCVWNYMNGYQTGNAYAGRSGVSAYRTSASYVHPAPGVVIWIPADFITIQTQAAPPAGKIAWNAAPWDIALVTTPAKMGDVVGWMRYGYAGVSTTQQLRKDNAGYPVAWDWIENKPPEDKPAMHQLLGLYQDPGGCQDVVWEDSTVLSYDGYLYYTRYRTDCDISGGHSGSAVYTQWDGSPAILGVMHTHDCTTCPTPPNAAPAGVVRITPLYTDLMSTFKVVYP